MFTNKDIKFRTIFVINCIEDRNLRVSSGELLLEDVKEKKTLTKLPFQKILALFVVGHIQVSTPLIEKCQKFNVTLVVMKPSLRPVFYWSSSAEANFLLRRKQYLFCKEDISIAKRLVENKVRNQLRLLEKTKLKNDLVLQAIATCQQTLLEIPCVTEYNRLMGKEGGAAKQFFSAYFNDHNWVARLPRTKRDPINATLDIGYTVLFNFMECFVRMFGFDVYVGVYHRLWFKRKSLICDLMEPFRCLIEHTVRIAYNRKQCTASDFNLIKGEYRLKPEKNYDYHRMFYDVLIPHKNDFFVFVQSYYRCFMQAKNGVEYPQFIL